jgi:hypothetical protein
VIRFDDPTTVDPADHEMLVTVVTGVALPADDHTLHIAGSRDQGIEAGKYRSVSSPLPAYKG